MKPKHSRIVIDSTSSEDDDEMNVDVRSDITENIKKSIVEDLSNETALSVHTRPRSVEPTRHRVVIDSSSSEEDEAERERSPCERNNVEMAATDAIAGVFFETTPPASTRKNGAISVRDMKHIRRYVDSSSSDEEGETNGIAIKPTLCTNDSSDECELVLSVRRHSPKAVSGDTSSDDDEYVCSSSDERWESDVSERTYALKMSDDLAAEGCRNDLGGFIVSDGTVESEDLSEESVFDFREDEDTDDDHHEDDDDDDDDHSDASRDENDSQPTSTLGPWRRKDQKWMTLDGAFRIHRKTFDRLYAHQREGIRWMWSLWKRGIDTGGILADDMGLGKTVQASTFVSGLLHGKKPIAKRALIVVPIAVMPQWLEALRKWGRGTLPLWCFHGSNVKRRNRALNAAIRHGGVCVTSYSMVQLHWMRIGNMGRENRKWDILIADEAHIVKNCMAKTTIALRKIPVKHRFFLTGTPIHNSLSEYRNLLAFAAGSTFDPEGIQQQQKQDANDVEEKKTHENDIDEIQHTFRSLFEGPIVKGAARDATDVQKRRAISLTRTLHTAARPFVLRRTKDVLKRKSTESHDEASRHGPSKELPPKSEVVCWVSMTRTQKRAYDERLQSLPWYHQSKGEMSRVLNDDVEIDNDAPVVNDKRPKGPLTELLRLQQICSHPRLLDEDSTRGEEEDVARSAKLMFLEALLKRLFQRREEDNRIVILSRSRRLLDIIYDTVVRSHSVLSKTGRCARVDGTTCTDPAERQHVFRRFNRDTSELKCILMTTQVGGVGVTLTGANWLVIMEPGWNPAVDAQAADRVHRIGQRRPVTVLRMVTCDSVEEVMYRRQLFKGVVREATLHRRHLVRFLSRDDIFSIFQVKTDAADEDDDFALGVPTGMPHTMRRLMSEGIHPWPPTQMKTSVCDELDTFVSDGLLSALMDHSAATDAELRASALPEDLETESTGVSNDVENETTMNDLIDRFKGMNAAFDDAADSDMDDDNVDDRPVDEDVESNIAQDPESSTRCEDDEPTKGTKTQENDRSESDEAEFDETNDDETGYDLEWLKRRHSEDSSSETDENAIRLSDFEDCMGPGDKLSSIESATIPVLRTSSSPSPSSRSVLVPTKRAANEGNIRLKATTTSKKKNKSGCSAIAFRRRRDDLVRQYYVEYNKRVFDDSLPPVKVVTGEPLVKRADVVIVSWNKRMLTSAGFTNVQYLSSTKTRIATMEFAPKVIDDESRLQETLLHEMCHVAAWMIDGCGLTGRMSCCTAHGYHFKKWASVATGVYPELTGFHKCHSYKIHKKWRWSCTNPECHNILMRHSKSVDVEKVRCGLCRSKFRFVGAVDRNGTPQRARRPNAYAMFVKKHFRTIRGQHPNAPHSVVMKRLAQKWRVEKAKSLQATAKTLSFSESDSNISVV